MADDKITYSIGKKGEVARAIQKKYEHNKLIVNPEPFGDPVDQGAGAAIEGRLERGLEGVSAKETFSSPTSLSSFLLIAAPIALVGLTEAWRKIEGGINNRRNINILIKALEEDIGKVGQQIKSEADQNKTKEFQDAIGKLNAFKRVLVDARIDAKGQIALPGILNGAISGAVLSTAIASNPLSLPLIAAYATGRGIENGRDLYKAWNKILPLKEDDVEISEVQKSGIKKINQIGRSERKTYFSGVGAYTILAIGATVATVSALTLGVGAPFAAGISLLVVGGMASGVVENIKEKFKPKNQDLGIDKDRIKTITKEEVVNEIAARREEKKLLKDYKKDFLSQKKSDGLGYSLIGALQLLEKYSNRKITAIEKKRASKDNGRSAENQLNLLQRMIGIQESSKQKNGNAFDSFIAKNNDVEIDAKLKSLKNDSFDSDKFVGENVYQNIINACENLEIMDKVIDKFVHNYLSENKKTVEGAGGESETATLLLAAEPLTYNPSFITINGSRVTFNRADFIDELIKLSPDAGANKKSETQERFLQSLNQHLFFDHIKALKDQQYSLDKFYWSLEKQEKISAKTDDKKADQITPLTSDGLASSASAISNIQDPTAPIAFGGANFAAPTHISSDNKTTLGQNNVLPTNISNNNRDGNQPNNGSNNTSQNNPIENAAKQKELLKQFDELAKQNVETDTTKRTEQVTQQNKVIEQIKATGKPFNLFSKEKSTDGKYTTFIYVDPNDQGNEDKRITYVRDDSTKKIEVIYGKSAAALVVENADQAKNGVITKINNNSVEHHGKIGDDHVFKTFKPQENSQEQKVGDDGKSWVERVAGDDKSNNRIDDILSDAKAPVLSNAKAPKRRVTFADEVESKKGNQGQALRL